jgi:hypothetical protein
MIDQMIMLSKFLLKRFATRKFFAIYECPAAWAAKKYRGHRTISDDILAQFDKARPYGPPN